MGTMTQLNTRLDAELKRRGDAVFARAGLSPSQVVRAVWQSAADTQQVPACVLSPEGRDGARRLAAVRSGAGLASRMAEELGVSLPREREAFDYKVYRDQLYDERLQEMEARRVGA